MGEYERNLAPHEQAEKDRSDLNDLRKQLDAERAAKRKVRLTGSGASEISRKFSIHQQRWADPDGIHFLRTLRESLMREYGVKVGESPFNVAPDAQELRETSPDKDRYRRSAAGRASDLVDALAELERTFAERSGGDFTLSIEARL